MVNTSNGVEVTVLIGLRRPQYLKECCDKKAANTGRMAEAIDHFHYRNSYTLLNQKVYHDDEPP